MYVRTKSSKQPLRKKKVIIKTDNILNKKENNVKDKMKNFFQKKKKNSDKGNKIILI